MSQWVNDWIIAERAVASVRSRLPLLLGPPFGFVGLVSSCSCLLCAKTGSTQRRMTVYTAVVSES